MSKQALLLQIVYSSFMPIRIGAFLFAFVLPFLAFGQANVGGDTTICSDIASYRLFTNPTGGVWSGAPVVDLSIDPGPVLSAGGLLNPRRRLGTFTVTYTSGGLAVTKRITVIDAPIANAGPDTGVCSGSPLKVIGKPALPNYVYFWTRRNLPASGLDNPTQAQPTVTLTNSDSLPYQVVYYLIVTDTITKCSSTDSVIVSVWKQTNATIILPRLDTLRICGNDSAFLMPRATPTGGFWTGAGISFDGRFGGTFTPNVNLEGEVQVTYILPCNGPLPFATGTLRVRVPRATAMPDFAICANADSVKLVGSPLGGTWTGAGVNAAGRLLPDTSFTGRRQYIYRITAGKQSCFAQDTTTVTFSRFPKVKAGPDLAICATSLPRQLTGFTPANGVFSCQNCPTGLAPLLNGNLVTPNKRNVGTWVVRYTVIEAGCAGFKEANVVVQPTDSVFAGPDTAVCSNSKPFNLSLYGPPNGRWTGPGVNASGRVTPSPLQTGFFNLYYTITSTNGCIGSDSIRIQYRPSPGVPVAGADTTVCANATRFNLTRATPAGGQYYNAAGLTPAFGIDTILGTFTPSRRLVGAQKIYYQVRTPLGCKARDSLTIDVRPLPEANAGLDFNVCSDADSLQIGSDRQPDQPPAIRYTYAWTGAQGTSGFSSTVSSDPRVKFQNNDTRTITNTYFVNVTRIQAGSLTCSNRDTIRVSILPKPTAAIMPNLKEKLCEGDSVTLRASTGPRFVYQWFSRTTLYTPIPTRKDSVFVVRTSGRYFLRIIDTIPVRGSACSDTSDSDSIFVKKRVVPTISGIIDFCAKGRNSLQASPASPLLSYQWFKDGSPITSARDTVYRAFLVGSYRVLITDGRNGVVCVDTSTSVKVDSIPLPFNDLVKLGTDSSFSICTNSLPLTLFGPRDSNKPNAFTYRWQNGSTGRTFTIDTLGKFYLNVSNQCGSFTDTLKLVSIIPTPTFTILGSGARDTTVCKDIPFTLKGPELFFKRWYYQLPNGSIDSVTTSPSISINTNTTTDPESRFVRLTIGSSLGCSYTDTIRYTIQYCDPIVYIPTAFTPQGDSKNEFWALKAYSVSSIRVYIYDRWGQQVYYAADQATVLDRPWDGTYKGQDCISGSYKYIVEYEGLAPNQIDTFKQRKTGTLVLIR